MAAIPRIHFSRRLNTDSQLLLGGRYIGLKAFFTFALETLWLALSTTALVLINQVWTNNSLSLAATCQNAFIIPILYLSVFFFMDLYDLDLVAPRRMLVLNLTQAVGLLCIAIGVVKVEFWLLPFRPWILVLHLILTACVVVAGRVAIDRYLRAHWPLVPVAYVGGTQGQAAIDKERASLASLGFVVHCVADSLPMAQRWLDKRGVRDAFSRLILDDDLYESNDAGTFINNCLHALIRVEDLNSFIERALGKVRPPRALLTELSFCRGGTRCVSMISRRLRDIMVSLAGLLITAPFSLLLALAIKWDSPGPILFAQTRIGKNGTAFTMLKFRSMNDKTNPSCGTDWTTAHNDPRITRVGALLRALHLDELPQLINVIKGDMSLVGPRPFHPLHFATLARQPGFTLRQLVLPGITGWAQIRCDYSASVNDYEEVLARDLYYIKHASFIFDLIIMVDTLRVCVWRKGAR